MRPPLLHSVPAMYELIRVCRSLAAEKQNVLCVCVRQREREKERVREFTQALQARCYCYFINEKMEAQKNTSDLVQTNMC